MPGLSRWFPSDSIQIWKRRHDLRIDITLVGFENGSWKRGNITFLLLGKRRALYCLDHDAWTCSNLLGTSRPMDPEQLKDTVDSMMGSIIATTNIGIIDSSIAQKGNWLYPRGHLEDVGMWKCTVCEMQDIHVSLHVRQRSKLSMGRVENLFSASASRIHFFTDMIVTLHCSRAYRSSPKRSLGLCQTPQTNPTSPH